MELVPVFERIICQLCSLICALQFAPAADSSHEKQLPTYNLQLLKINIVWVSFLSTLELDHSCAAYNASYSRIGCELLIGEGILNKKLTERSENWAIT